MSEEANNASKEKAEDKADELSFRVVFKKEKLSVCLPASTTIGELKAHLQPIINIPPAMMKVMVKGLAQDDMSLSDAGVVRNSKVMVVGSSLDEVLQVSTQPSAEEVKSTPSTTSTSTPTAVSKMHERVMQKGKPDDAMPGLKDVHEQLPPYPLSGMLNKSGGKVRLTFKLETDELWVGTKERTQKLPLQSIKTVISEPMEKHEEYHRLALQLGPTEASRYWIYWVPAQYVEAIKEAVLGKWQFF